MLLTASAGLRLQVHAATTSELNSVLILAQQALTYWTISPQPSSGLFIWIFVSFYCYCTYCAPLNSIPNNLYTFVLPFFLWTGFSRIHLRWPSQHFLVVDGLCVLNDCFKGQSLPAIASVLKLSCWLSEWVLLFGDTLFSFFRQPFSFCCFPYRPCGGCLCICPTCCFRHSCHLALLYVSVGFF